MGIIQVPKQRKYSTLQTIIVWHVTVLHVRRHGATERKTVEFSRFQWKEITDASVKGDVIKDKYMVGRSSNCFQVAKDLHLLGIIIYYLLMNNSEVLHTLLVSKLSVYHPFIFSKFRKTTRTKGSKLVKKDTNTYQCIYKLFPA